MGKLWDVFYYNFDIIDYIITEAHCILKCPSGFNAWESCVKSGKKKISKSQICDMFPRI